MRLYSEFQQGLITSNNNITYSKYLGFLEFHAIIRSKFPVIIGLKGGGAFSNGEIPFYGFLWRPDTGITLILTWQNQTVIVKPLISLNGNILLNRSLKMPFTLM